MSGDHDSAPDGGTDSPDSADHEPADLPQPAAGDARPGKDGEVGKDGDVGDVGEPEETPADDRSEKAAQCPEEREGTSHPDPVARDEPLLAARVHRPVDLMRFLFGMLGIAVVLGIAGFAHATTSGVEQDIADGATHAPQALIAFAGFTASIAVLIVPVAFAIERLIKRDGLRIADGVLAAVLAHGVSLATDLWVSDAAPAAIRDALTRDAPSGGITDPVHGYLAPVIAYMTAVGMARRPRWRVGLWCVLVLDAFAVLVGGYTTPFSIITTVLIGWTVA
ncbi:MAG: hypothetical protein QOF44_2399, partial [Streptomyces sp.]|nr:hypothetical protein [Streptomyces sp.]